MKMQVDALTNTYTMEVYLNFERNKFWNGLMPNKKPIKQAGVVYEGYGHGILYIYIYNDNLSFIKSKASVQEELLEG